MESSSLRLNKVKQMIKKVEELQLSAPIEIEVDLTSKCNFRCIHCYNKSGEDTKELPLKIVKSIIDQAADMGVFLITVMGGEPLLYPHFFEVIDYITYRGLLWDTSTNASLITLKTAKELSKRTSSIQVSLNAVKETTFLKFTGTKYLKKTIQGISNLIKHNIEVNVAVVPTTINYKEIPEICRVCGELGVNSIRLIKFVPAGRSKNLLSLKPDEKEMKNIFELCKEICKDYGMKYLIPETSCEISEKRFGKEIQKLYACKATRTMVITPEGYVVPCALLSTEPVFYTGNIYKNTLEECWRHPVFYYFLSFKPVLNGKCRECPLDKCPSCRAYTYLTTGDLYAPDPSCPFNWKRRN